MKPFQTYNGGKNGSGVYQSLINLIPPHEVFISGFLGNCGVLANKKPAEKNIGIDLESNVIIEWENLSRLQETDGVFLFKQANTIDLIPEVIVNDCRFRDKSKIFIFLDPPYLDEVRSSKQNYYTHDLRTTAAHIELCDMISRIPNGVMVMLTHYPCDFYDNKLKDWNKVDIQGRTRKGMRTERVYMNYPLPQKLHDYTFFGKDFREREKFNRIRKNMIAKLDRLAPVERNYILNTIATEFLMV